MIKVLGAVTRRPGMTHAEYLSYIQHVHGKITTDNPLTISRYMQSHVFDGAFGSHAEATHCMPVSRDSVTELYFEDGNTMKKTFSSDHVKQVVGPDGKNFSDEANSLSVVVEEVEQSVVNPSQASGAKVMHFIRAIEGMPLNEFFDRWSKAHDYVLANNPIASHSVRRCVHNRQLPEFNEMLAYFGGKDAPIYEGVGSLWFDDVTSVNVFREYEKALMGVNENPDTAFYRPDKSFFLYAREVLIYDKN